MQNFIRQSLLLCFVIFMNKAYSKENKTPTTESLSSNLYISSTSDKPILADGNLVEYNNSFSAGVDYMDAKKLPNINENFGLMRDGVLLAIERRPLIAITDTLFFYLTNTQQTNYQFQLIAALLNHPGLYGNLQDSYTGISTPLNLNGTTTINFSIDSSPGSQNPSRFMVVFNSSNIVPVQFTGISAELQGDNTKVLWNVDNEINIKQYKVERSTDGNKFIGVAIIEATGSNINSSNRYAWVDENSFDNNYYYRIQSIGINSELVYSKIVRANSNNSFRSIRIFPNPVEGGLINLKMNNIPDGIYRVHFFNIIGTLVKTNTIHHDKNNTQEKILLNNNFAKGIYKLELNSFEGEKIASSIIYIE